MGAGAEAGCQREIAFVLTPAALAGLQRIVVERAELLLAAGIRGPGGPGLGELADLLLRLDEGACASFVWADAAIAGSRDPVEYELFASSPWYDPDDVPLHEALVVVDPPWPAPRWADAVAEVAADPQVEVVVATAAGDEPDESAHDPAEVGRALERNDVALVLWWIGAGSEELRSRWDRPVHEIGDWAALEAAVALLRKTPRPGSVDGPRVPSALP